MMTSCLWLLWWGQEVMCAAASPGLGRVTDSVSRFLSRSRHGPENLGGPSHLAQRLLQHRTRDAFWLLVQERACLSFTHVFLCLFDFTHAVA